MPKERYVRVDSTDFSHVICCQQCSWRTMAATPATAWKKLAIHLKDTHRDFPAAGRAREMMKRRS